MLLVAAPCGSGSSSSSRTVPLCPVMGTCQRHSPGELKIDLGHPFATSARIAHGLPVGEAALIKRTIFKEPGCREEEVLIGWWQWLRCRTGLGWVPVLQGDPHTQKKALLGSRKDRLPSPCLYLQEALMINVILLSLFYFHRCRTCSSLPQWEQPGCRGLVGNCVCVVKIMRNDLGDVFHQEEFICLFAYLLF